MRLEIPIIAGTVLQDGRLYLYIGVALLVLLAVIVLIALALRGVLRKSRQ